MKDLIVSISKNTRIRVEFGTDGVAIWREQQGRQGNWSSGNWRVAVVPDYIGNLEAQAMRNAIVIPYGELGNFSDVFNKIDKLMVLK